MYEKNYALLDLIRYLFFKAYKSIGQGTSQSSVERCFTLIYLSSNVKCIIRK